MNICRTFLRQSQRSGAGRVSPKQFCIPAISNCPTCRYLSKTTRRRPEQPGDDPNFMSIIDSPPMLVRAGRRHGPGLIVLGTFLKVVSNRHALLTKSSIDPHNRIRPRDMASTTAGLEVETYSKIRRSTCTRSSSPPTTHRSNRHQGV